MTIVKEGAILMPDSLSGSGVTKDTDKDGVFMRWAARPRKHFTTVQPLNTTRAQAGLFRPDTVVSAVPSRISGIQ